MISTAAAYAVERRSSEPTRCLLTDADPADRCMLSDLLCADGSVLVVGDVAHGVGLRAQLTSLNPDVLFVDARLPGRHLAALTEAAVAARTVIVLVSAVASDAALGFRLGAVDFLRKPYSRSDVQRAMFRARCRLNELALLDAARQGRTGAAPAVATADATPLRRGDATQIAIAVTGGIEYVPVASIEWIGALGYGTRIYTADRTIPTRTALATLLRWMDTAEFIRTHRATAVNVRAVRRLHPRPGGTAVLTLRSGQALPVAKRRLSAVRQALRIASSRLSSSAIGSSAIGLSRSAMHPEAGRNPSG